MAEGGLGAPVRHPIPWQDPDFYDAEKLDAEMRRVFDICHGCRRCFNLCDSFPRLFDLVDASPTGELDRVASTEFAKVVDACTLCDMCFLTKCPYVPPHEFDLDFPHLMVRARAVEARQDKVPWPKRQLTQTDRNGRLGCAVAGAANWATRCGNALTRPAMEALAGVHREAELPRYAAETLEGAVRRAPFPRDRSAPAAGRKAAVFATCFANYNSTQIGLAALEVLARNGVETELVYPGCCGMPQLENGDLGQVAEFARRAAAAFAPWIGRGYAVVSLVPSCSLMMKFEWPLLLPDDAAVKALAKATADISEYVVDIARKEGLAPGIKPLGGPVTMHMACHARAQNVGQKGAELVRLIPGADVKVIERCSGHGGAWGVMKENFDLALKVGRPVARQAAQNGAAYVLSECPLARDHIVQGMAKGGHDTGTLEPATHPIELVARAYRADA